MSRDPYILPNGVLRNKLGIEYYDILKRAERDIAYTKMLDAETVCQGDCNIDMLKKIHKHIFEDIYDWAGEFRTIRIYKRELIIPCVSLEYAKPRRITKELTKQLEEMNAANWKGKSIDELTKQFVSYLAKIWIVHPFRDGNTRTTLTFASIFAKQHGFTLDLSSMIDQMGRITDGETGDVKRWSIRDKFVLAALDEKNYPEPQALEKIVRQAILNGKQYTEEREEETR